MLQVPEGRPRQPRLFEYPLVEVVELVELIRRSVTIKGDIDTKDPREQGLRKVMNFGHTIGNTLEG